MNAHNSIEEELKEKHFRVAIFGSARTKPGQKIYQQVFELAKEIGKHKFDVVTGGGPGMMEAAAAGHQSGDPSDTSDSIGLNIKLPMEQYINKHIEIKKDFNKFSGRLDHFMALSSVVIVVPGGIGTCLELFYTWQLVQVKHICPIPIILIGDMWKNLIEWVKDNLLAEETISPEDLDNIYVVKNNEEAMKIIMKTHGIYEKEGDNYCMNINKYQLNGN